MECLNNVMNMTLLIKCPISFQTELELWARSILHKNSESKKYKENFGMTSYRTLVIVIY